MDSESIEYIYFLHLFAPSSLGESGARRVRREGSDGGRGIQRWSEVECGKGRAVWTQSQ